MPQAGLVATVEVLGSLHPTKNLAVNAGYWLEACRTDVVDCKMFALPITMMTRF